MSITFVELIEKSDELFEKNKKGLPKEVAEQFAADMRGIIENVAIAQVHGEDAVNTAVGLINIPDETVVNPISLLSLSDTIKKTRLEDNAYSNFQVLLKGEEREKEIFNSIVDDYDMFGLDETLAIIKRKGYNEEISSSSPLYTLFDFMNSGNDFLDSVLKTLEIFGVDINEKPIIKIPPQVKRYLDDFATLLNGLVNLNGSFYKGENSSTLN